MRPVSRERKQILGTYRADRDRQTPLFPPGASCPNYLTGRARAEWKRVAPLLSQAGVLQQIDQSLLASYCTMYGHWRASEEDIQQNGLVITVTSTTRTGRTDKPVPNPAVSNSIRFHKAMMATAVKFGINPLDRPRIEIPPDEIEDEPEDDGDNGL